MGETATKTLGNAGKMPAAPVPASTVSDEHGAAGLRRMTAAQEWRAYWPMVLAAFVSLGFPIMPYNSLGLFIEPLSHEFGWSRTIVTAGASLAAILAVPCSPFIGALVDRWGVRRLALPGLILTASAMAAFGLATGSPGQWLMLWGMYAVVALLLKSTIWTAAISHAFTAGRSVALAVVLSGGTGFSAAITPPLAEWLIDEHGWRAAYWLLAVGWGAPAFLLSLLFLRDIRGGRDMRQAAGHAVTAVDLPGLTVRQALRSPPLIRIAIATFFTLILTSALIVHKVPLLTEAGVTRQTAAWLTSLSGIAGLVGGLTTGWLLGRFNVGLVGGITNAAMAVSLVPLLEPFRTPTLIVLSMLVVGYAGGTKLQMCSYLTGLYGGMRNYGKIFGLMASIIAFTGAMSPMFGSAIYDLSGSYTLLILIGIPLSLISSFLLFGLGPIPDWTKQSAEKG